MAYKEINKINERSMKPGSSVRTPIGCYGGVLSSIRPEDLGEIALEALMQKVGVPPEEVEDVYIGCDREGETK